MKYFVLFSRLFAILSAPFTRSALCTVFQALSIEEPSLKLVVPLLEDMTATTQNTLQVELDYERAIKV